MWTTEIIIEVCLSPRCIPGPHWYFGLISPGAPHPSIVHSLPVLLILLHITLLRKPLITGSLSGDYTQHLSMHLEKVDHDYQMWITLSQDLITWPMCICIRMRELEQKLTLFSSFSTRNCDFIIYPVVADTIRNTQALEAPSKGNKPAGSLDPQDIMGSSPQSHVAPKL